MLKKKKFTVKPDKVQQNKEQARVKNGVESGVCLYDTDIDTKGFREGPCGLRKLEGL